MPIERLTKIDDLTRREHHYLTPEDTCYYLGEYTARKGYAYSHMNQVIINLKICPSEKNTGRWPHKEHAIQETAQAMRQNIDREWVEGGGVFVPVPPSKAREDPLYDPRMTQVLQQAFNGMNADIRELIIQTESTEADHIAGNRIIFDELYRIYEIDEGLSAPEPGRIAIVDDIVSSGKHFKVTQKKLLGRFPNIPIIGLFVARAIHDADTGLWNSNRT